MTTLLKAMGSDEKRTHLAHAVGVPPNPSIERTSQRPLRTLWPAAHVER